MTEEEEYDPTKEHLAIALVVAISILIFFAMVFLVVADVHKTDSTTRIAEVEGCENIENEAVQMVCITES